MIPSTKPLIGDEEKQAILKVLDSGMLAQGEEVQKFENAFAHFIGVKHAIATSNGTAALHTALLAHGIHKGDEVITSPFSFIATANTIRMCGATPVFVDIEEDSFNINPDLIEGAITEKTKAIMPVHLYGKSCDMDAIAKIARQHNLHIIEDACQAHGATWNNRKVGSFGTGCFSFYPTKNMTTGEGGIITTNNDTIAKTARKLISHGSEKRYYNDILGFNYRMTNISAAIGIAQLKKLPQWNKTRNANAAYLTKKLQDIPGLLTPSGDDNHVFHQYSIRIVPSYGKTRGEVIGRLKENCIHSSIYYPVPIHKQKAYSSYNHLHFHVAERIAQEILSLPIHPRVTTGDLDKIAEVLRMK